MIDCLSRWLRGLTHTKLSILPTLVERTKDDVNMFMVVNGYSWSWFTELVGVTGYKSIHRWTI